MINGQSLLDTGDQGFDAVMATTRSPASAVSANAVPGDARSCSDGFAQHVLLHLSGSGERPLRHDFDSLRNLPDGHSPVTGEVAAQLLEGGRFVAGGRFDDGADALADYWVGKPYDR